MKNLGEASRSTCPARPANFKTTNERETMEIASNSPAFNSGARMSASALTSVANLSVAQALHERICLLYLRLEGCPRAAQSVVEFDLEAGWGLTQRSDREALYQRLVEALCAYEEATEGGVHPVEGRLAAILL